MYHLLAVYVNNDVKYFVWRRPVHAILNTVHHGGRQERQDTRPDPPNPQLIVGVRTEEDSSNQAHEVDHYRIRPKRRAY